MLVCAAGQDQERVSSLAWSGFQDIMIQKHWEQPQTMMSEYQTTAAAVRQFFLEPTTTETHTAIAVAVLPCTLKGPNAAIVSRVSLDLVWIHDGETMLLST